MAAGAFNSLLGAAALPKGDVRRKSPFWALRCIEHVTHALMARRY
jgi:hypothetical protein